MLEGGVGRLGEPFWRQAFGGYPFGRLSVHLQFGLQDEMGQGGEAGDAVFEWESRPHGEAAKIDLLEVKRGTSVNHWPR